jgi:heme oxygenase (biliverdin-IX-beta and delta-forming)
MVPLFARLKSGTEQQHREIEALIDPMKNFASLEAYKAHLLKTWTFYRPLEANLAALDWGAVGIDFDSRRKVPLLEEDIRFLRIPHSSTEDLRQPLDRTNLEFALGCLYVLEGATLGGQVISRHLAKLDIGPESGGRFFNGYGAKTGEMWKSFQTSATSYCVTDNQIGEAVNGAQSTFRKFRESMLVRQELSAHVA